MAYKLLHGDDPAIEVTNGVFAKIRRALGTTAFGVNELRVPVPSEYMERMRLADGAEKARAEGVRIAQEMSARVRHLVKGVQLSAPFGRYEMAIQVAEALGER